MNLWLLAAELFVVGAALVAMFRIRKAADKEWAQYVARHSFSRRLGEIARALDVMKVEIGAAFLPTFRELAAALAQTTLPNPTSGSDTDE